MPGEFGQVGSYITRIKLVLPSGELLDISESDQPDPPRQRWLQLISVVAGALKMLQRLRPLPLHLLCVSENPLDPWVVEVLGWQIGCLQHGVKLAMFYHRIAMIDQQ